MQKCFSLRINPSQYSAKMSLQSASIASSRDIWAYGRWSLPSSGRKKILNRVEERQVGGKEIGKVSLMDCKPVYLLHVNGGMHCTMQSQMTSCFVLHVPFQLFAPIIGGGQLKTKEGAHCCREQSEISAGPNQPSRLQQTLWHVLLFDPAHHSALSRWCFFHLIVFLPG